MSEEIRTYDDLSPEEVQKYREKRGRFYMYLNQYNFWKHFSDKQRSKAIMAILNFEKYGELPTLSENDVDDVAILPYLDFFLDQAQKDFKSYVNTALKNKKNGAKSHSNVESEEERTLPNATERYHSQASDSERKRTEPDKIRQDKIKSGTERYRTEPDKIRQDKIRQDKTREDKTRDISVSGYIERATDKNKPSITPPEYQTVTDYCKSVGLAAEGSGLFSAKAFMKYYSGQDWMIDGEPVTDWRPLIDLWLEEHSARG